MLPEVRLRSPFRTFITAALAVAVIACGAIWLTASRPSGLGPRPNYDVVPEPEYSDETARALSRAFRSASQRALPGVVHVRVMLPARRRANGGAPNRTGEGSGFVIREDGYILTNDHVVRGAERVTVVLPDRREYSAEIVGRDPNTDIAVLHIGVEGLPVVEVGDSDRLDVGDWVVALGYPLQLGSTATAGIVSAKGRNIRIMPTTEEAPAPLENFIQTDAAINPGNSGGPLVDLEGRVVGMNTAIASPTGLYSGYGFAIPINLAHRVADDLMRFGELHRPRLGVAVEDVDPADSEVYGLECVCGSEIVQVTTGTAADRAGLRLGDVVLTVDGTDIASTGQLLELLARSEPGQAIRLGLMRGGHRIEAEVPLGEFEPSVRTAQVERPEPERGVARLGFAATELDSETARRLDLESGAVVISDVDPTHPAARAPRLAPGQIVESVNGERIHTLLDLRNAADRVRPGQAISLIVRTGAGDRTIINYRLRS
jgi:serine protease Do